MKTQQTAIVVVLISAAVTAILAGPAHAQLGQRKPGDPRVGRLLDQIGLKYEVDVNGDFRLPFLSEETGRHHVVYINSRTATLGGLEVREIWAPAFASESMFPAELLNNLLEENNQTIVGAWRVISGPQGYGAVFSARIAADAHPQALATLVRAVCLVADHKEQAVTNGDNL
jgi:hypothetical protein